MLAVTHLTKTFGPTLAVHNLSFTLARGEVLAFLGPNGAGKSTTIKILAGFFQPDSGNATLGGHDVLTRLRAAQRLLGYLPENGPLYPEMTVREFLLFAARVRGLRGEARDTAIARAVETCQLAEVYHQTIGTLSKGYRQRTSLAQAILHDPPCLILDEPTEGLAPNQKQQVREAIRAMAAEKAIIIATHNLAEAEAVCTRFLVIAGGEKQVDESPEAFRERHPHRGAARVFPKSGKLAELRAALAQAPGIERVENADDSGGGLLAIPEAGRSALALLPELARAGKLSYERLEPVECRTEEVFRQLTQTPAGANEASYSRASPAVPTPS